MNNMHVFNTRAADARCQLAPRVFLVVAHEGATKTLENLALTLQLQDFWSVTYSMYNINY